MKKGIEKLSRGFLGIVIAKLIFIIAGFIVQSCELDEGHGPTTSKEMALVNFESVLKESLPLIRDKL